jgi:hypothetical protein
MRFWWAWVLLLCGCGLAGAQTASVAGVVLDMKGNAAPGARVTLTGAGKEISVDSDAAGAFRFLALPSATVRVTVTAKGLETFVSHEIRLVDGEHFELPRIALPIAPLDSEVTVTVTEDELATEQVHEQEKQRLLGVLPNFYTSYLWNAAPMRSKQKFQLIFRSAIDPAVFVTTAISAGISQARNSDPGYGQGAAGYARRYGARYGDAITGRLVGGAILPAVFHQDPRYFYRGTGSVPSRAWYAVTRAVVTRGDNGKSQPNYSAVLGSVAGAGLRNLYLDPDDRSGPGVLLNGLISVGFNGVGNLLREFVFVKVITGKPGYTLGKPAAQPALP